MITNENQLIGNLSRIRIRSKDPKPLNNAVKSHKLEGSLEGLSLTTSESSQNKPVLPTNQKSDDKNWFTHYFFESNDNNFAKNSEKFNEMKDKNVYQKRQSFGPKSNIGPRFEAKSRPKPINYMELPYIAFNPMEFYWTQMTHFEDKPLIAIRYRSDVFKAIKLMLESMFRLKALKYLSFDNQWKAVTDDMLSNGWTGYSPEKSRKQFFKALNLYKKVCFSI